MIQADKIFPVYKVENDCMLSVQGDITIGYAVVLPDIFSLSSFEYESFHQSWVKALKVLPMHSVFHKQDYFFKDSYKANFETTELTFLSHSSERFFNERAFLNHQCYIFLTKKPQDRKLSDSAYCNLMRKSIAPEQTLHSAMLDDFLDAAGQFVRILSDAGFVTFQRLLDADLAGTATQPGIIERYSFLLPPDKSSVIKDIRLKNGIEIGDHACQLYTIAEADHLPNLCGSRTTYDAYSTDKTKFSIGFASPLGHLLDCNHIYNQYVFITDAQQTLKKLEAKKLRLHALSAYSRENASSRDAVDSFLNECISNSRIPVKAHFNVFAWSEHGEEADLRNKISSAMAAMDATPKQEVEGQAQIWFAGIPGNQADFPMNETFDTFMEQASCFFNPEGASKSSPSPLGLRMGDRLTGKPLHVDISDEPIKRGFTTNRNKFILGPSGSGKSFFTNHLVRSYYEQGCHVLLIDVGHSYKGLCDLVGGYYFTYSPHEPIAFNPFFLAEGELLDSEKKESLKTLLLALSKEEGKQFTRSEYVGFSNGITLYFAHLKDHPDIFPGFNSFYEFFRDEYTRLLTRDKVREQEFDVQRFLYVLAPYYKGGEFDYLLNATTQLDLLNEPFIVFELDQIKDHPILFPAVTLIIMEVFISKMRKLHGIRKMILIEECWKAIAKEGMADYIRYLFKTVRKFFGEAVVVTQEVEDIISSPIVKHTIINNADCKILLDQSKYQNRFDLIQELLGLSEKDKALVLSMNRANEPGRLYKEVFFSLGGQSSQVYRTEVSLEEYLCYTTEEKEKIMVMQYASKYGSVRKAITMLAKDLKDANYY